MPGKTVTFLEMTAPDQFRPARELGELKLEHLGANDLELYRSTCLAIGEPHDWRWRDVDWRVRLESPDIESCLARVTGDIAGLLELEFQGKGDVEITVMGLVPEFIDRGIGGALLTRAVQRAWSAPRRDGGATTRVWLHTSTHDHPHALANYERRGFRAFRREERESD